MWSLPEPDSEATEERITDPGPSTRNATAQSSGTPLKSNVGSAVNSKPLSVTLMGLDFTINFRLPRTQEASITSSKVSVSVRFQ